MLKAISDIKSDSPGDGAILVVVQADNSGATIAVEVLSGAK